MIRSGKRGSGGKPHKSLWIMCLAALSHHAVEPTHSPPSRGWLEFSCILGTFLFHSFGAWSPLAMVPASCQEFWAPSLSPAVTRVTQLFLQKLLSPTLGKIASQITSLHFTSFNHRAEDT